MHICVTQPQWVNSLWPSDAISRQGSRSTLVQVMACCLTAPSHYLNQCWLIITKVQWCLSEGNFAEISQPSVTKISLSFIFMPPPLGAGGIMFSGCPSVRPSVRLKPEIPSFDLYIGPLVHPTNRYRFTACPSVRPSVCPSVRLSVRPSGEVSGHLPENAWRD